MAQGQFQGFRCRVANGDATVYAVWELTVDDASGYTTNEALTWGSTGVGNYVSAPNSTTLRIIRTSGEDPEVGDTITGTGGSPTSDVLAMPTQDVFGRHINPPRFDDSPSQQAVEAGDLFMLRAVPQSVNLVGIVSSTINPDNFELETTWAGSDADDVQGFISRDFETNYDYPVAHPGDAQAAAVYRRAIIEIGADAKGDAWHEIGASGEPAWETAGWGSSGSTRTVPGFYRIWDRVYFQGMLAKSSPSYPADLFQLTSGHIKEANGNMHFSCPIVETAGSGGVQGELHVEITAGGMVRARAASATIDNVSVFASLDNISYRITSIP